MFKQNLQVYCRVRGLSNYDIHRKAVDIAEIYEQQIKIQGEIYKFDKLVKGDQIQMNMEIKEVDQWFITYGGCATGKTTTMFGENGVIYQICGMYINHFKEQKITMSMIEIRESKIIDLYVDKDVKLQESNQSFSCSNLTNINIESFDQFSQVLKAGQANRYMSQVVMNNTSSRFPILLKIEFGNFSLQFCDMVGYEKPSLAGDPQVIKQSIKYVYLVSTNNTALSLIERIAYTKNEKERLLLCNSALLTKIMKNAFRNAANLIWIFCISSADWQIKDTLRTLNIIKI